MSNINVPSKFVNILDNFKSFQSSLWRSVDLNILYPPWYWTGLGKEQRACLDGDLNSWLEVAALKQFRKEAGVAGGQRRELDLPSSCITFPLNGSCNGPFPTLHTVVYCIFAYSVFSRYLHVESVVSGLWMILKSWDKSLWGLTSHGNQVYLCDKEHRAFSVFVGIAWLMAVLFFIYLCTVIVLFLCSTFRTFLLKKNT